MKILYLLVVGLLYFCADIQAANWMSPADILKVNTGQSGATTYWKRSDCGSGCHEISSHDLRREKRADVSVDDLSKPVYRVPELSPDLADCTGSISCMGLGFVCSEQSVVVRWDMKSNWPNIPGPTSLNPADPWFLWCEKVLGYDQKLEEQWVLDSAMVAIADSKDSIRAQLKTDLISERSAALVALNNWDGLTQAQKNRAMKRAMRILLRK